MKNAYKDTLFDLSGKVAVVMGGLGQIGIQTAKILIEAGAKVAICDFREISTLDKCPEWLEEAVHKKVCLSVKVDVTDKFELEACSQYIIEKLGNYSIVVNHVHYKGSGSELIPHQKFFSSTETYPLDIWNKAVQVNLTGAMLISQVFGRHLISNKGGVLVNTSSTYGIVSANPNIYGDSGIGSPAVYAATKAALINFSRYLATHWAPHNIRVNILSPGGVENEGQTEEFKQNYIRQTPIGRMAESTDYAGAILFLVSDASQYMTGSNLVVDGGWTAW